MRISRLTALTLAASAAALAAPAAAMAESTAAAPQSTPSAAAPAAPGRMTVKLANKVGGPALPSSAKGCTCTGPWRRTSPASR